MTSDANKGITNITYNHLNLPTQVTIAGQNISYIYDATGTRMRKTVSTGATTDYAGNYVYENGDLKQISQPEGYIEPDGNGWQYVYRYTDIWGNTRLTYSDDNNDGNIDAASEIRREQNYYPFGLEHKGYNNVSYGVKNDLMTYQGQEFTEDLGLNTHEWKYRMSDPSIGRFWQVDPLAESYAYNSTYAFQENKMGMGVELEGAELKQWFTDLYDYYTGAGTAKDQLAQSQGANISDGEISVRDAQRLSNGLAGAQNEFENLPRNLASVAGSTVVDALDFVAPDGIEIYTGGNVELFGASGVQSSGDYTGTKSLFMGNSVDAPNFGIGTSLGPQISQGGSNRKVDIEGGINFFYAFDGTLQRSDFEGGENNGSFTIPLKKNLSLNFNLMQTKEYVGFGVGLGPKSNFGWSAGPTNTGNMSTSSNSVLDEKIKDAFTIND
ncbi:hypothetical protein U1E44_05910 [Arenibacter sp. GZD96]|uniref:hypothetical protein n=1 Tax=Aurantibrevibacter litoralis TaxID=3106030 RepID=UPI002AFE07EC|nr:hypothetical protein [Arenibacter sp. GZD-96]MEA1785615.1 hypothetical protein [Arenibacter sp. GZD-96]